MKTLFITVLWFSYGITTVLSRSIIDSPEFEAAFDNLVRNYASSVHSQIENPNEELESIVYKTGATQNVVREAIRRLLNDKTRSELWSRALTMAQNNEIHHNEIAYWLRYHLEMIARSGSDSLLKKVQSYLGGNRGLEDDWQRLLEIANSLPTEQAARAEKLREMARSIKSGQEYSKNMLEEQRVFEAKISAENAQAEQSLASPGVSKTKPKSPANIKPAPAPPAVIPEVATISTTSWLPWLLLIVGALAGVGLLMRKQGR